MMIDSDTSETNLVIITKRDRFTLFCKLYWRSLVIVITPLILLPIAFISTSNVKAYKCLYVFILTATYWTTDALHPSVAAMVPIALSSVMDATGKGFVNEINVRNDLLDCVSVLILIIALEQSQLNKRVALKLLIVVGCSHYRLSFFLFFGCMLLSMWFSSILVCGLMMPLVKVVLSELERMGILEIYETVGKAKQKLNRHGESHPRPSAFTVFYFLGIAYSSSIGAMATLMGSQTNQIFKIYCEKIFPTGPKIEFPNVMLLYLPGVVVMEAILYFWMNFYFVGMFRRNVSLEIGMTEEETQYVKALLATQYQQRGKITFYEGITLVMIILAALLQATLSKACIESEHSKFHNHLMMSCPCLLPVLILFVTPKDLDFLAFFKISSDRPLPQAQSKRCISWLTVRNQLHWSVIFVIVGSTALFESLHHSHMTEELEKFLCLFKEWPSSAQLLIVILLCKFMTEFAPSASVAFCLLPVIARLSILSNTNPHYLMVGATFSISLPFHLVTSAPVNAMVAAYVHIPPWKMMSGGIAPSVAGVVVSWFTAAAWATTVWPDITQHPHWADNNTYSLNMSVSDTYFD